MFALADPDAAFEIICEHRPEGCQNEDVARALLEDNLELVSPPDPDV